jgi:hypothetical protein
MSRKELLEKELELWKEVEGYDGDYLISTFGRVRSYKWKKKDGEIRKEGKNSEGYIHVDLYKEGKQKTRKTSVLLAEAFIPNPNNHPEVDHINGDKTNNHISNLKWSPRSDNQRNKKGWGATGILGLYYCERKNRSPFIQARYRNKEGKPISKCFTIDQNPRYKNAKEGQRGYCYPSREAAEAAGRKWLRETRDVEFPDVYIQCYIHDKSKHCS